MEWKEVRLGDVCDLVAGYAFKAKDFGDFPHKVIKIGDINPPFVNYESELGVNLENYDKRKLEKYLVRYDDFVLAMTGATIGKVGRYIAQEPSYLNQRVLLFKAKENVCSKLLYYIVTSPIFAKYVINHIDSESAQPNISAGTISKYELQIPSSIDAQRRISSILSSLDRKIELNNKINATLEEMAQALFKSWFVDFEPFKNGNFIDTEIGKIPEGWRVGTLSEVAEVSSGKRPPLRCNAKSADASIPLIGAAAVMGYTSAVLYNTPILVTGRVGTHGVVQRWCEDCWPSDNTLVITSNYYEFTYQLLKRIDYKNLNRGSTQPLITQKDLKETCVVIPPINVLNNFEQLASSIMKPSEQNVKESLTLTHLRDTLLPRLMSGEIEV